jgi:hypothetical protein
MEKLFFLSVLFVNVFVPARAAAQDDPKPALKRALLTCAAFDAAYPFLLVYVVPRLF